MKNSCTCNIWLAWAISLLCTSCAQISPLTGMVGMDRRSLEQEVASVRLLEQSGRLVQARERYEQLLRVYPDEPRLHQRLGILSQLQGDNVQAIERLEKALQLDPMSGEIMNDLGFSLHMQGDHRRAVEVLRKAQDINPHEPRVQANLAMALAAVGEAKSAYSLLRQSSGESASAAGVGFALVQAGHADEAQKYFAKAIESDPENHAAAEALIQLSERGITASNSSITSAEEAGSQQMDKRLNEELHGQGFVISPSTSRQKAASRVGSVKFSAFPEVLPTSHESQTLPNSSSSSAPEVGESDKLKTEIWLGLQEGSDRLQQIDLYRQLSQEAKTGDLTAVRNDSERNTSVVQRAPVGIPETAGIQELSLGGEQHNGVQVNQYISPAKSMTRANKEIELGLEWKSIEEISSAVPSFVEEVQARSIASYGGTEDYQESLGWKSLDDSVESAGMTPVNLHTSPQVVYESVALLPAEEPIDVAIQADFQTPANVEQAAIREGINQKHHAQLDNVKLSDDASIPVMTYEVDQDHAKEDATPEVENAINDYFAMSKRERIDWWSQPDLDNEKALKVFPLTEGLERVEATVAIANRMGWRDFGRLSLSQLMNSRDGAVRLYARYSMDERLSFN